MAISEAHTTASDAHPLLCNLLRFEFVVGLGPVAQSSRNEIMGYVGMGQNLLLPYFGE